jgi:hypothetical protein
VNVRGPTYLARIWPQGRPRRLLGILAWLGVFSAVAGYFVLFVGPRLGLPLVIGFLALTHPVNWDVIQAEGSDCQLSDRRPLSNNHGVVAVLREANCPGDFAQGTAFNVIFVHRPGEPNTRDNLVFQYTPGFIGDTPSPLPTLTWTSASKLEIAAPGVIETIVVQKREADGITLTYRLGRVWPN